MKPSNKENTTAKQSNFTQAACFAVIHVIDEFLLPVAVCSDLIERAYFCPFKTNHQVKQIIGQASAELNNILENIEHIRGLAGGRFWGMPKTYENFSDYYSGLITHKDTLFNALFKSHDNLINSMFGLFDADKEQDAALMVFTRSIEAMQAELKIINTAILHRTRSKTCGACKNGCNVFKGVL